VGHVAAADVVVVVGDGLLAPVDLRRARRVVAIDEAELRVVGEQAQQRLDVALFDAAAQRLDVESVAASVVMVISSR
jgi:hypothetical protein